MRFLWWDITHARVEHKKPQSLITNKGGHYSKPRHLVQGKQKMVLLHLHTGPATEIELVRTLKWDSRTVSLVLGSATRKGLMVYQEIPIANRSSCANDNRLYTLTSTGRAAAQWFLANPRFDRLPKRWKAGEGK